MKLRVTVDSVEACITLDSAWTPELLATLLRECGDEVVRVCLSLCDAAENADPPSDVPAIDE